MIHLTYMTRTGDLVLVRYYHQFVAKQPDGYWYGFESKPEQALDRWEATGYDPDELAVITQASLPSWQESLEEIDFSQVQRII